MLWCDIGKLGTGKTLAGVIWAYTNYCEGKVIFSNIKLKFPHIALKEPEDFLKMKNGCALLDELYTIADNRKSMTLLNDLNTIICVRSRKKKFDIRYNQQTIKVDCRIVDITDKWVKPQVYPYDPNGKIKITPNVLVEKIYNANDLTHVAEKKIYKNIYPYLRLYDSDEDPYTMRSAFSDEKMLEAYRKIREIEDSEKK